MRSSTLALKAATLLFFAADTHAFWRMPCRARSGLARLDPLVDFGAVSQHVHAIHGSSGMSTLHFYSLLAVNSHERNLYNCCRVAFKFL